MQEDDELYAGKVEFEATQDQLMQTNNRIDVVQTQLIDLENHFAER